MGLDHRRVEIGDRDLYRIGRAAHREQLRGHRAAAPILEHPAAGPDAPQRPQTAAQNRARPPASVVSQLSQPWPAALTRTGKIAIPRLHPRIGIIAVWR